MITIQSVKGVRCEDGGKIALRISLTEIKSTFKTKRWRKNNSKTNKKKTTTKKNKKRKNKNWREKNGMQQQWCAGNGHCCKARWERIGDTRESKWKLLVNILYLHTFKVVHLAVLIVALICSMHWRCHRFRSFCSFVCIHCFANVAVSFTAHFSCSFAYISSFFSLLLELARALFSASLSRLLAVCSLFHSDFQFHVCFSICRQRYLVCPYRPLCSLYWINNQSDRYEISWGIRKIIGRLYTIQIGQSSFLIVVVANADGVWSEGAFSIPSKNKTATMKKKTNESTLKAAATTTTL